MIQLLITDSMPHQIAPNHNFGGLPVAPAEMDFVWPHCKSSWLAARCNFSDDFVSPRNRNSFYCSCARTPLVFVTNGDAEAGGNRAIVVTTEGLAEVQAPKEGVTVRGTTYGAHEVTSTKDDYLSAREAWTKESRRKSRDVLGPLLGEPSWIQGDETPKCNVCGKQMRFLAQFEQGPESKTQMNFGGGCAYLFDCSCSGHSAKFLWQC